MGKLIGVLWGAALLTGAGMREGIQFNAQGLELYASARYAEAEVLYLRAVEAFGKEASVSRGIAMQNLGMTLRAAGRFRDAAGWLQRAVDELETLTGGESA